MIRQISLAALVAVSALSLSGCVSDYAYRDGPGDYYYGRPSVDYDYYGSPYGGYGYGGAGSYGGIGYGSGYYGGYGSPYGYGGNVYVVPRYYGGGRYHRDRDGKDHRPDRDGRLIYNRDARGSDKASIVEYERNRALQNGGRGQPGRARFRSPDPSGQVASPLGQRQGSQAIRQPTMQDRGVRSQPRAVQPQMRSAPQRVQSAPRSMERGQGRSRVSER